MRVILPEVIAVQRYLKGRILWVVAKQCHADVDRAIPQ